MASFEILRRERPVSEQIAECSKGFQNLDRLDLNTLLFLGEVRKGIDCQ